MCFPKNKKQHSDLIHIDKCTVVFLALANTQIIDCEGYWYGNKGQKDQKLVGEKVLEE